MVVAIVQARTGSTRLPGKVLKEILGKPMLWHLINRLKHAQLVDKIIIATSDNDGDKPIISFAEDNAVDYYAGSELDLVDRLFQAAKKFGADAILRITGDCPLVDPALVDKVIKTYLDSEDSFDYVSNVSPRTYPDGLDTEIFSFQALKRAWEEVKDPFRREWITTNFHEHPEKYRLGNVEHDKDLSYMRWTVDYQDDLDFVTEIYERLYQKDKIFLMDDILDLLKKNPELMEINRSYLGEDGYMEALKRRVKGMYHPFIIGEKIYLRGLEKSDLTGNMFQWANDPEVTYYMFMGAMPNTIELLEEEYEQLVRSKQDVVFAVVEKETDIHIGNVGLYVINWISRSAEFRIIIGEKEYWNKGYGTEATKLTVEYAFEKLNLNKVWLGVNAAHISAIKSYEKAGFVHEGVLRQEIYRNGNYCDAVRMSILREEYYSKRDNK